MINFYYAGGAIALPLYLTVQNAEIAIQRIKSNQATA